MTAYDACRSGGRWSWFMCHERARCGGVIDRGRQNRWPADAGPARVLTLQWILQSSKRTAAFENGTDNFLYGQCFILYFTDCVSPAIGFDNSDSFPNNLREQLYLEIKNEKKRGKVFLAFSLEFFGSTFLNWFRKGKRMQILLFY